MASLVDIANRALDLVGQSVTIMALTDNSTAARKANLHIYPAIREVLRAGKWKPARKPAVLAQLATPPAFTWAYAYQLPGDYLRFVQFNEFDPTDVTHTRFEVQGKLFLTDEISVNLIYVADLTATGNDINVTDEALTNLFVLNLASKLAWPFQQSRTLKESLLQQYTAELKAARAADAREEFVNPANRLRDSEWLVRRSWSTNG